MNRREYLITLLCPLTVGVAGCSLLETDDGANGETAGDTAELEEATDVEIVVVDHEIPERVAVGDPVELAVTLENQDDEPGRYRETLVATPDGPQLQQHQIEIEVPANETAVWRSDPIVFEHGGRVSYRLPDAFEDETILITPASKAPQIEAVNLVTEWADFGDTFENATDTATVGDLIEIADRHRYWHEDGQYHIFRQVRILDDAGERVAIDQHTEEQMTDTEGFDSWEGAVWFDTAGWELGSYTAEVLLRNELTGERSEPVTTEFEIED